MALVSILLAIFYPLAPVAQLVEGVHHVLACFRRGLEDPDYLDELRGDYAQLAELDRVIADMEAILHIAVWRMARFKLGLPYKEHRRNGRARPGNRLSVESVRGRLERACRMLGGHRPATPPLSSTTTTTIFRGVRQKSSAASPRAGQRIRAPPWPGRNPGNSAPPSPQALPARARHHA